MAGAIIAVANLKGGVGKTTLAVNLGCQLAEHGLVALVDADTQQTASEWIDAAWNAPSGPLPIVAHALPLETERDAEKWVRATREVAEGAAFVLIDLPPVIGAAAAAAMMLARVAVLPVTPSSFDLRATARALELVRDAREIRKDGRPKALLVPSKVDRRTGPGREIEAVLHDFGEPVGPAIGQRTAFIDAGTAGSWIGGYAAGSAGHTELVALAAVVRRMAK